MSDLKLSEEQLLAAVMATSGRIIDEVDVDGSEFYAPAHENLWDLMRQMREVGIPVDVATVISELTAHPIRGMEPARVAEISESLVSPASAPYHAGVVRQHHAIRQVQSVATRMAQTVAESGDAAQVIEDARGELDRISREATTNGALKSTADLIDQVLADLGKPGTFWSTPWGVLNDRINGLRAGRVYVIGARPSSGKSIMGMNLAVWFQQRHNLSTAFSSLEMDDEEVVLRSVAQMAGIDFRRLSKGDLSDFERKQAQAARDTICQLPPLYVDDRTSVRPVDVRAHARNVGRKAPLGLVVVDYLGLMESGQSRPESRQVEVAQFSRSMKNMARELHVPVVVLAQLNRGNENRADKEPRLADLRDSGAVEQDADVVLLLHRPTPDAETVQVGIGKNRQGPRDAFELDFDGARMRMTDRGWGAAS